MIMPGQKVVCVDDVFPEAIKRFFWHLPVKGVTYTVRDVVPGVSIEGMGDEITVYLVELINPCSDAEPYPERGFKVERFRPLETVTKTEQEDDEIVEDVPNELVVV